MSRWQLRFPDSLPFIAGLLTFVLFCGYVLAVVGAEFSLGRPSSTAALAYIFGPLLGLFYGAIAFLIGMAARWIVKRRGVASAPISKSVVSLGLVAVIGILITMFFHARTQTIAFEFARRPRVIVDSPLIKTTEPSPAGTARVEAQLVYGFGRNSADAVKSIDWNGRVVSLGGADEHLTVRDTAGALIASTDLHDFDYINVVRAVPFCKHADGTADLAVLVTLRATSGRSMLIVYGTDGHLIYQEHLERTAHGDRWAGLMFIENRNGAEVLTVEVGQAKAYTCSAG